MQNTGAMDINPACFHLLVVDDDPELQKLLRVFLEQRKFLVTCVGSLKEARIAQHLFRISLVLLDVMLPDEEGFAFVQNAPSTHPPVIFLSARTAPQDRIKGLQLGGADYLTKPFEPEELFLRMERILKEKDKASKRPHVGPWQFCEKEGLLHQAGRDAVSLTASETTVLHRLLVGRGKVLSREVLAGCLDNKVTVRSIDVLVARLRRKIQGGDLGPSVVQAVRGEGYRLRQEIA
jgi:two-component system phosphate regulon response regulator OmpR